jgi:hypothetical protein
MVEFSDGVSDLDSAGTKHVLSADRQFFYVRSSCTWRFYTVSRLSLVFWDK